MTVLQFLKTQNSKSFWLLWIEPERFFHPFAPFENQVLVLCWHSSLSMCSRRNIIDINTSRICDFIIKPKSYYFFPIPRLIGNRDLSSYGSSRWKEGNCEVLKINFRKILKTNISCHSVKLFNLSTPLFWHIFSRTSHGTPTATSMNTKHFDLLPLFCKLKISLGVVVQAKQETHLRLR